MRSRVIGAIVLAGALITLAPSPSAAGADTLLARVKGTVGYLDDAASPMNPIVATLALRASAIAVTQANSAALVTMPDSSEITLGEKTQVTVGAFKTGTLGPGSTISVNHGALMFAIKHPGGGRANYSFTTTTSQIAIRGTSGYIASNDDEDAIAVTQASTANDVVVKAGGKTYHVAAGKTLHIKKRQHRVLAASFANGAVHPSFGQFHSLHKPSGLGAGAAAVAGVAAGAAVKAHADAAHKKKKHH